MSTCTICEIKKQLRETNKNYSEEDLLIRARKTYERIELLQDKQKGSKDDAKSNISACIKKKMDGGMTEEQARLACTSSSKSKEKKSKNSQQLPTVEDLLSPVLHPMLIEIQLVYKQMRILEYTPIEIYQDIQIVRHQINELENRLWDLESDYRYKSGSPTAKQDIIVAKIQAQQSLMI